MIEKCLLCGSILTHGQTAVCKHCASQPGRLTTNIQKSIAATEYWQSVRTQSEEGSGTHALAERMIQIHMRRIERFNAAKPYVGGGEGENE